VSKYLPRLPQAISYLASIFVVVLGGFAVFRMAMDPHIAIDSSPASAMLMMGGVFIVLGFSLMVIEMAIPGSPFFRSRK